MKFKDEVLLLGGLRHANIVALIGAVWEVELMALVMEYCANGMSSSMLVAQGAKYTWQSPLLKWCINIAQAVKFLHAAE